MPLNTRYLKEISDLFVEDLKRSEYYRELPVDQQRELDDRLFSEASQGMYPLVPGADDERGHGWSLEQPVQCDLGNGLSGLGGQNVEQPRCSEDDGHDRDAHRDGECRSERPVE